MRSFSSIVGTILWLLAPVLALGPILIGLSANYLVEHKYISAVPGSIGETLLWAPVVSFYTVPAALIVFVIAVVLSIASAK